MKMMSMGSMFSGILRRLKRVRETKATLASRMLSGEERTKVAKEARATTNGAEVHRKVVKAFGGGYCFIYNVIHVTFEHLG